MKKIAVIGAGIFGCSAAIELAKKGFQVTIFEKEEDIFKGATKKNHLRHHYGYHYPRSKKTALESIKGRKSFEKYYKDCVIKNFPAYYAVAKSNSKSTPKEFLKFCDNLDLKYKIVKPNPKIFDVSKISLCLETPEPAYDPKILKDIILKKIRGNKIKLNLSSEIIFGNVLKDGKKRIRIKFKEKVYEKDFDFIVSAIYSNFNKINQWFGFPEKKFRYDLMELLDMELPIKKRLGAMVIDGDFSTFVPLKKPGVVRLGNVKEVRIKTIVTNRLDVDKWMKENKISKKESILKESIKYFPILKDAKFLRSIFIVRVVKENVEKTDERLTEITSHGNGIYSIFAGKVITCVEVAKKIEKMISKKS